jgi:hypothetical protein
MSGQELCLELLNERCIYQERRLHVFDCMMMAGHYGFLQYKY